jgi:hypothetical protein
MCAFVGAASAEAKVFDKKVEAGWPGVVAAYGYPVKPSELRFKVSSPSPTRIKVKVSVNCSAEKKEPADSYKTQLAAVAPVSRRVPVPVKHPTGCLFTVEAKFLGQPQDTNQITVTLSGNAKGQLRVPF